MGSLISKQLYTKQTLEAEAAPMVRTLTRVAYSGPGVLQLEGAGFFFNPAPPISSEWLCGVISEEEFTNCIKAVNSGVIDAMVGLPRSFRPSDFPVRLQRALDGAQTAIADLNARMKDRGVSFILDKGAFETTITSVSHHGDSSSSTSSNIQKCTLFVKLVEKR